jgi:hypothetical protein
MVKSSTDSLTTATDASSDPKSGQRSRETGKTFGMSTPAFAPESVGRDARAVKPDIGDAKEHPRGLARVSIVARRAPNASLIPTKRREVYRK